MKRAMAKLDVICLGEALWDVETPRGTMLADATSLRLRPGGAAVNAALALAKRGHTIALAAVVGDDALGRALAARVAKAGVHTAFVQRAPPRTGVVFVERAPHETTIVGYRHPDEPAPELPPNVSARALLITGVAPSETHARRFGDAARALRARGAVVVVDVNARPRLWRGGDAQPTLAWLRDADVVKASDDDLATMRIDIETMRSAMAPAAVLVVTAGPREARAIGAFGEVRRAPSAIERAHALGAGDAFAAGIVDAMLRAGDAAEGAAFWDHAIKRGHGLARKRVTKAKRKRSS